ncbi:MAG: hypothetical protein ACRC1K_23535 [Planctomycetia bacterium]
MDSVLYVSPKLLTTDQLAESLISFGGRWDCDVTLNQGHISTGDAAIYVYPPKEPSIEYDEDEIHEMTETIGTLPLSVVCIDIGHGEGSFRLAKEIASRFIENWHGFLDLNGIVDNE